MELKKILLPTDFSEAANAALTEALFLASQYNAELHLLHVVVLYDGTPLDEEHHFPQADDVFRHLSNVATSEMAKLLDEGQGRVLKIRQHQMRAVSAAPAIIEFAVREEIDLIVMGGHGRRGLRRFVLGSVAEEVVREAPCPVLTLRRPSSDDPVAKVESLLVPVDFSEDSAFALGVARGLARAYRAKLEVVHAVEEPTMLYPYEAFETNMPQIIKKVEEALAKFVDEDNDGDIETRLRVLVGSPARAIADHAREIDAGVVVIASHGLSALERFLLGSVTNGVLRLADCPVLTLRRPAT